jgi:hypothetical protein
LLQILGNNDMDLPVLIEALPDGARYTARLGEPLNLAVEAATADEAQQRLTDALRRRLQQGAELRSISVPVVPAGGAKNGYLPDDELTQQWLQAVQQFREECHEADERLIAEESPRGKAAS